MNTENVGRQAKHGSLAVEKAKPAPLRAMQFLSCLVTYTIAAFALATLTLFGIHASLDQVKPAPAGAVLTQDHGHLPAFAEKLASACWQGPQATMLATPAARCMAVASAAVQHLAGIAGAGSFMERLGAQIFNASVNGLQKAVRLTAPSWFGHAFSSKLSLS